MRIKYNNIVLFIGLVLIFLAIIYLTRPAPDVLGSYSASLEDLSSAQRRNICLSARKMNGIYINPRGEFSFNSAVGPRTLQAGFVPARVLFEGETMDSVGGGICLVSSALYNAVIRSNFNVKERVAHTRLIKSIPVGLDATVWYGTNDLRFENATHNRVRIDASCGYKRFNVSIKGNKASILPQIIVKKQKLSPDKLQVCVYKKYDKVLKKLSEDIYSIR